jgi:hypothetical protein
MSNTLYVDIDVLAGSPVEINEITARLNTPSNELVDRLFKGAGQTREEVQLGLARILSFSIVRKLGNFNPDLNRALRFRIDIASKRNGVLDGHLFEISTAFPTVVFLIERYDPMYSFTQGSDSSRPSGHTGM